MTTLRICLVLCILASVALSGHADTAWQPVTAVLIAQEKPGYGGLSGVVVDRTDGRVYIDLSDRGVFRSADGGRTWKRHCKEIIKGRTETPGCLQIDPTGRSKRILLPTVYGAPIGLGSTESADWRFLDPKVTHVDWCAFDWSAAEPKLVLTLKHESGGVLLVSRDGGKNFEEAGKGFGPAWVFDSETAVVATVKTSERPKGAILRTVDGGKTFQEAADYAPLTPLAALPRPNGDALYLLVQGALVKTTDKGATWTKVCDLQNAQYGPVFGRTPKDLFVLTRAGIIASSDDGASWSAPLPIPDWKGASQLTWIDYDPANDLLYAMKMGSDLYRLERPK